LGKLGLGERKKKKAGTQVGNTKEPAKLQKKKRLWAAQAALRKKSTLDG